MRLRYRLLNVFAHESDPFGTSQVIAQVASVDAVRRARANPGLLAGYAGMGVRGGDTLVHGWSPAGEVRL